MAAKFTVDSPGNNIGGSSIIEGVLICDLAN